jgi:hypothetical protein
MPPRSGGNLIHRAVAELCTFVAAGAKRDTVVTDMDELDQLRVVDVELRHHSKLLSG